MLRKDNANWWFEMLIPNSSLPIIQRDIGHCINLIMNSASLDQTDKTDWLTAHDITSTNLINQSLIRVNQLAFTNANESQQLHRLRNDISQHFNGFILPTPSHNLDLNLAWLFIPKLTLNGVALKWHPLLSNYLFAFMLSSVLRYQPHLFPANSRDEFIAEAWCNQSASSSLRYFLMELSRQNVRIN